MSKFADWARSKIKPELYWLVATADNEGKVNAEYLLPPEVVRNLPKVEGTPLPIFTDDIDKAWRIDVDIEEAYEIVHSLTTVKDHSLVFVQYSSKDDTLTTTIYNKGDKQNPRWEIPDVFSVWEEEFMKEESNNPSAVHNEVLTPHEYYELGLYPRTVEELNKLRAGIKLKYYFLFARIDETNKRKYFRSPGPLVGGENYTQRPVYTNNPKKAWKIDVDMSEAHELAIRLEKGKNTDPEALALSEEYIFIQFDAKKKREMLVIKNTGTPDNPDWLIPDFMSDYAVDADGNAYKKH